MANTTKLEIVTPEALVYSDEVDMLTLPCSEGQIGVLPHYNEARQRAAARLREKISSEEVASVDASLAR